MAAGRRPVSSPFEEGMSSPRMGSIVLTSARKPRPPQKVGIDMPSSSTTDIESTTIVDKHELDEKIEGLLGPRRSL
jgi:hypothetical protein